MAKTLNYKGFIGSIEVSVEDDCLFGKLEFINDVVTYEGKTISELRRSFESAVDGYLEMCRELGDEPERPFKGSFNVRIGAELHRHAALAARQMGISLNEFVVKAAEDFLTKRPEEGGIPTRRTRAGVPPARGKRLAHVRRSPGV